MISSKEIDNLKPLLSQNTLQQIERKLPLLSAEQRRLVAVKEEDIQGMAPYLFQKATDEANTRVFVKIGMLYFVVPGFSDTLKKVFEPRNSVNEFQEAATAFKHNLIVADYRQV
jgi:hypothetical protein